MKELMILLFILLFILSAYTLRIAPAVLEEDPSSFDEKVTDFFRDD